MLFIADIKLLLSFSYRRLFRHAQLQRTTIFRHSFFALSGTKRTEFGSENAELLSALCNAYWCFRYIAAIRNDENTKAMRSKIQARFWTS